MYSVCLECQTTSLDNLFPTFQENLDSVSWTLEVEGDIFFRNFGKTTFTVTQFRSQKVGTLDYTDMQTSKLVNKVGFEREGRWILPGKNSKLVDCIA